MLIIQSRDRKSHALFVYEIFYRLFILCTRFVCIYGKLKIKLAACGLMQQQLRSIFSIIFTINISQCFKQVPVSKCEFYNTVQSYFKLSQISMKICLVYSWIFYNIKKINSWMLIIFNETIENDFISFSFAKKYLLTCYHFNLLLE